MKCLSANFSSRVYELKSLSFNSLREHFLNKLIFKKISSNEFKAIYKY